MFRCVVAGECTTAEGRPIFVLIARQHGWLDVGELSSIQITPAFFNHLRSFREFQDLLNDLDVADEDQLDLFDTLDVDGSGAVDLEELIVGICKLRGDARRSDIVGVSLVARAMQTAIANFERTAMDAFESQGRTLKLLEDTVLPGRRRTCRSDRSSNAPSF